MTLDAADTSTVHVTLQTRCLSINCLARPLDSRQSKSGSMPMLDLNTPRSTLEWLDRLTLD